MRRGFELQGARCLLTGGSSGIGRALASELARHGVRLAIAGRRIDELERTAQEVVRIGGVRPIVLQTDLSLPGAAAALADAARDRLGGVDLLVSNAGAGMAGSLQTAGEGDAARALFEVNFWAPLALASALTPAMRDRGFGAVVNVTSVGIVLPVPLIGHYTASKAALSMATRTLRSELRGSGVHVLEVVPGLIETPMLDDLRAVPGTGKAMRGAPVGTATRLAGSVVRALRRGRDRVVYPGPCIAAVQVPAIGHLIARQARPGNRPEPHPLGSQTEAGPAQ